MSSVVTFGEIMLCLSAPDHERFEQARVMETSFAGAEANVATALANLGVPARFVSRLPANDLASACLKSLRAQGVDVGHVVRGGERLGLFFVETGAAQRASKVIYDRTQSGFATIEPGMVDWAQAFTGADWFHWTGITPAVGRDRPLSWAMRSRRPGVRASPSPATSTTARSCGTGAARPARSCLPS